ncbi:hypothetical protein KC19_VG198100 [Ceratodon purpureus]|uniref:Uncharacterized protein n=1 Tax=Ceratodon purpureus TaxID=3225 RepID=A0A8T0HSB4_CERPU|nr:hypothetical protein KC19_VG198100 [Ceratodon purpureus]
MIFIACFGTPCLTLSFFFTNDGFLHPAAHFRHFGCSLQDSLLSYKRQVKEENPTNRRIPWHLRGSCVALAHCCLAAHLATSCLTSTSYRFACSVYGCVFLIAPSALKNSNFRWQPMSATLSAFFRFAMLHLFFVAIPPLALTLMPCNVLKQE